MADLPATGRADIVGFGDAGVYTALTNSHGSFQEPALCSSELWLRDSIVLVLIKTASMAIMKRHQVPDELQPTSFIVESSDGR